MELLGIPPGPLVGAGLAPPQGAAPRARSAGPRRGGRRTARLGPSAGIRVSGADRRGAWTDKRRLTEPAQVPAHEERSDEGRRRMAASRAANRSNWWPALIASSCLLVAAGGGDRGGRGRQDRTARRVASPVAGPSASAVIDPCLVGTWRTSDEQQQLVVSGVGAVTVSGSGVVLHIGPDGSDLVDYASASPYTGTANGHQLEIADRRYRPGHHPHRATARSRSGTCPPAVPSPRPWTGRWRPASR